MKNYIVMSVVAFGVVYYYSGYDRVQQCNLWSNDINESEYVTRNEAYDIVGLAKGLSPVQLYIVGEIR